MTATFASESLDALGTVGFVRLAGPFARLDDAWNAARVVVDAAIAPKASVDVIADYVIPPPDGPTNRDFQTLHLDFGLPLVPVAPADVACFTALHIAAETPPSGAATRLVPVRSLLAGRRPPDCAELVRRLRGQSRRVEWS